MIYPRNIMRTPSRFIRNFANFRSLTRVAMGLSVGLLPAVATASPAAAAPGYARTILSADLNKPGDVPTGSVCTGEKRCHAHVHMTSDGHIRPYATPQGFGANGSPVGVPDPGGAVSGTPTVAIVDAYGYANLASDLATYRSKYGLPACTVASGCLKIVNQTGAASPLPASAPANDDWTVETALDVDMVERRLPGLQHRRGPGDR